MDVPVSGSRWLTPWQCRAILVALLALNFFNGWRYLTHDCPIDLSGDEAQYWDWSRHPDWAYYSKGPMVAWVIRLSCTLLGGDTMPAVRAPALVLAVGTSLCTYWLTRKLFGSDRLALGAVVLGAIVPLYAAGGMLMTIDPPLFFFWALATCFAAAAIFDGRRWCWVAAGIVCGLGVLTKYVMLLWPPFVVVFLLTDAGRRPTLKTIWPWTVPVVAVLFLTPVLVWNANHDWVSLHHVTTQTGVASAGFHGNTFEFLASQLAAVNPLLGVPMAAAVVRVFVGRGEPAPAGARFLLVVGGLLFLVCLLDSVVAKVQANWPAPAYFTLLILTAWFVSDRWRPWRGWFISAVIFGLLAGPILHDPRRLYPVLDWRITAWVNHRFPRKPLPDGETRQTVTAAGLDLEHKMRGIKAPFAETIGHELESLPGGAFVLCEDYMDASQLAFYLPGRPKTYFAGSYWTDLAVRRRWTQFDLWPDRQLDRPELIGRDVVYVGTMAYAPLRESFDSVQRLADIPVVVDGHAVRSWTVWRCRHFHGMSRPPGAGPR